MSKEKYKEFIEKNLKKKDTVMLSSVKEVSNLSKPVQDLVLAHYENEDPNIQKMGSMLNAMYTQHTTVFMISIRILNNLIKKDMNIKSNSCHSTQYNEIMHLLQKNNILTKLREPAAQKAGLYELTKQDWLSIMVEEIGKDVIDAKKQAHIEWYDNENTNKQQELEKSREHLKHLNEKRKEYWNQFFEEDGNGE